MGARIKRSRAGSGMALVVTLFVMMVVLIAAGASVRAALSMQKAARAERDRHIALQGAEAALADAERDIEGGADPASARAALFARGSEAGFVAGCGTGRGMPNLGLCRRVAAPAAPAWQAAQLDTATVSVAYGTYTGATMPTAAGSLPAFLPRYLIELLAPAHAGAAAPGQAGNFYRITAIGFGANAHTRVVLQSTYQQAGAAPQGSRLGWREVANWPDLHQGAK